MTYKNTFYIWYIQINIYTLWNHYVYEILFLFSRQIKEFGLKNLKTRKVMIVWGFPPVGAPEHLAENKKRGSRSVGQYLK